MTIYRAELEEQARRIQTNFEHLKKVIALKNVSTTEVDKKALVRFETMLVEIQAELAGLKAKNIDQQPDNSDHTHDNPKYAAYFVGTGRRTVNGLVVDTPEEKLFVQFAHLQRRLESLDKQDWQKLQKKYAKTLAEIPDTAAYEEIVRARQADESRLNQQREIRAKERKAKEPETNYKNLVKEIFDTIKRISKQEEFFLQDKEMLAFQNEIKKSGEHFNEWLIILVKQFKLTEKNVGQEAFAEVNLLLTTYKKAQIDKAEVRLASLKLAKLEFDTQEETFHQVIDAARIETQSNKEFLSDSRFSELVGQIKKQIDELSKKQYLKPAKPGTVDLLQRIGEAQHQRDVDIENLKGLLHSLGKWKEAIQQSRQEDVARVQKKIEISTDVIKIEAAEFKSKTAALKEKLISYHVPPTDVDAIQEKIDREVSKTLETTDIDQQLAFLQEKIKFFYDMNTEFKHIEQQANAAIKQKITSEILAAVNHSDVLRKNTLSRINAENLEESELIPFENAKKFPLPDTSFLSEPMTIEDLSQALDKIRNQCVEFGHNISLLEQVISRHTEIQKAQKKPTSNRYLGVFQSGAAPFDMELNSIVDMLNNNLRDDPKFLKRLAKYMTAERLISKLTDNSGLADVNLKGLEAIQSLVETTPIESEKKKEIDLKLNFMIAVVNLGVPPSELANYLVNPTVVQVFGKYLQQDGLRNFITKENVQNKSFVEAIAILIKNQIPLTPERVNELQKNSVMCETIAKNNKIFGDTRFELERANIILTDEQLLELLGDEEKSQTIFDNRATIQYTARILEQDFESQSPLTADMWWQLVGNMEQCDVIYHWANQNLMAKTEEKVFQAQNTANEKQEGYKFQTLGHRVAYDVQEFKALVTQFLALDPAVAHVFYTIQKMNEGSELSQAWLLGLYQHNDQLKGLIDSASKMPAKDQSAFIANLVPFLTALFDGDYKYSLAHQIFKGNSVDGTLDVYFNRGVKKAEDNEKQVLTRTQTLETLKTMTEERPADFILMSRVMKYINIALDAFPKDKATRDASIAFSRRALSVLVSTETIKHKQDMLYNAAKEIFPPTKGYERFFNAIIEAINYAFNKISNSKQGFFRGIESSKQKQLREAVEGAEAESSEPGSNNKLAS